MLLTHKNKKIYVKILTIALSAVLFLPLLSFFPSASQPAKASVTNNGVFFFGDTANAGVPKIKTFTNPATFGTVFNGPAGSASNILWVTAKTAPTREEMMLGTLKVDGRLDISTCTAGCDAPADFTARWNNPGTTAVQDCNTGGSNTCVRAFDIAYEQLKGRGMVMYADTTVGKVYYALWDNSAWSPNATPGSPGASNEISLPAGAGTPKWIRLIVRGDQLAEARSNQIMALVADSNNRLYAYYWDGSAWDAGATLFTALGNCGLAQCFDGGWETLNGRFVAAYTNSAAAKYRYNIYTPGPGWNADAQITSATSAGQWISGASDPASDRIMFATSDSGDDTQSMVWRSDGATDGWAVCSSGADCLDTSTENITGNQAFPAWERFVSRGMKAYNDAGKTNDSSYVYYNTGTFSALALTGIVTTDDSEKVKAWGAPNSSAVMVITQDVDCKNYARMWDGSAWATAVAGVSTNNSEYGTACPNLNSPGTPPRGAPYTYDFAWKYYSAWQRNWRFYSGSDTASVPAVALAAENTAPSAAITTSQVVRLRMQYAEKGTLSEAGSRKKLQFATGCNPNSAENTCLWQNVDEANGSGMWRYYTSNTCAPTNCTDNTLLTGAVLTGSGACSLGNGCGTWVTSGTAAGGANMDHNGLQAQESEYIIQNNGANGGSVYYFRLWDNGQDAPVYRQQDLADCGAGASQCTYPYLATVPVNVNQSAYRWFDNAGTLISSFNVQTINPSIYNDYPYGGMAVDAVDGTLYVAGILGGTYNGGIVVKRNLSDGSLVTAFGTGGSLTIKPSTRTDVVNKIVIDREDGALYAAGSDQADGNTKDAARIEKRSLTDGSFITSFGTGGAVRESLSGNNTPRDPEAWNDAAIDHGGGFLYVGGQDAMLPQNWEEGRIEKRLLADGSMVASFGTAGVVSVAPDINCDNLVLGIAVDVSGGYMYDTVARCKDAADSSVYLEKRLLTDGSLVASFGAGGVVTENPSSYADYFRTIALDASGGYFYVGGFDEVSGSGNRRWRLEKRSTSNGALDAGFGNNGVIRSSTGGDDDIYGLNVDSVNHKLYVIGRERVSASDYRIRIEKRLLADGSLVTAFGAGGIVLENPTAGDDGGYAAAVVPSQGVIYISAYDSTPGNVQQRTEARLISDGSLVNGYTGLGIGAPLTPAQDSAATLTSAGQIFRLRELLHISTSTLGTGLGDYKLQYAGKGSGTCASPSGGTPPAYTDVTSTSSIAFYNNAGVLDGAALIPSDNDPIHGSDLVVNQAYEEVNNFSNSLGAVGISSDGKWDFALFDNGASSGTTYCFRAVKPDGSLLDSYSVYPELTAYAGTLFTDIVDNSGNSVSAPSVFMNSVADSFLCQTATGTLGTASQRIRASNHTGNASWTLSIAASSSSALWTYASGTPQYYDYNDPANGGCGDGADADAFAGQMTVNASGAAIAPQSGCSSANISLGSSGAFSEITPTTTSVTLMSANASAQKNCYWDLTNVAVLQAIPAEQKAGNYTINMMVTIVAN